MKKSFEAGLESPTDVDATARVYAALAERMSDWPSLDDVISELRVTNPEVVGDRSKLSARVQVSRLLKEARFQKLLTVRREERNSLDETAYKIRARYRDLKEVHVVPSNPDYSKERQLRGEAIAAYLDQKTQDSADGAPVKIAMSGGDTLFDAINCLSERSRRIRIYPAALIGRLSELDHVDPSVLVTMLWAKSGGKLSAGKQFKEDDAAQAWCPTIAAFTSPSPEEKMLVDENNHPAMEIVRYREELAKRPDISKVLADAKGADLTFVSTASYGKRVSYRQKTNHPTTKILQLHGVKTTWFDSQKLLGDVNYSFFRELQSESGSMFESNLSSWRFFVGLEVSDLREMVATGKQAVVLTGGRYAAQQIDCLIRNGVCNVLITDENTAIRMLNREW